MSSPHHIQTPRLQPISPLLPTFESHFNIEDKGTESDEKHERPTSTKNCSCSVLNELQVRRNSAFSVYDPVQSSSEQK